MDISSVLELLPENHNLYSRRAFTKYMLGNFNGAIVDMTQAIDLAPNEKLYFYDRARFLALDNRHKIAIADFEWR